MRTRALFLAVLMATGLAVSESRHFCAAAITRSTHAFCQYFQALKAESLNPVERVMLSLALTQAKAHRPARPPIHS
jgi:hypothetical protein